MANKVKSRHTAETVENDWGSRDHVHALLLIAVTAVGIFLCYRLAAPFVPALAWALALAALFVPLQRWLEAKTRNPNLAAFLTVLVAALIVMIPGTFVLDQLMGEAAKGADAIQKKIASGEWRRALEANSRLAWLGHWLERQIDLPETAKAVSDWLTKLTASFVQGSVVQFIGLLLTFYLLFFFLRDRDEILDSIRSLSPLSDAEMGRLFRRVADTVHATLYGTLAVAAIQGTLGGLMFLWLGLSAPLLWGIVMGLLAVVPVLGAFVVWIPAAALLALDGSWGKALLLTVWGGVVVGGIDNVLYPMFVGNRLKLHTMLAFISVVGGLMLFGASGLILGPVVLTITLLLLEVWRRRNGQAHAA